MNPTCFWASLAFGAALGWATGRRLDERVAGVLAMAAFFAALWSRTP